MNCEDSWLSLAGSAIVRDTDLDGTLRQNSTHKHCVVRKKTMLRLLVEEYFYAKRNKDGAFKMIFIQAA